MNIAIVDDEEIWRTKARQEVESYDFKYHVEIDCFKDGKTLLESKQQYEIIFLDIEMKGIDGFETAGIYHEKYPDTIIIFLTTHIELGRKGYKYNAFRYIDKEYVEEEIKEALESAVLVLNRNHVIEIEVSGVGMMPVNLKDILYIESVDHDIVVHTDKEAYSTYTALGEIEDQVEEYGFFRCHKSYVVNLDKVNQISKKDIKLKDGSIILVSVRKFPELKRRYLDYKFKYANS